MAPINQNFRSNEQIRISPIRLIDHNEQQIGIIETFEAMRMAREAGLDLVEVAPTARPPVCRIMDFGKWKYSQKKNKSKNKKQHEQQLKEVRLRPKTDVNDRQIKVNRAIKFFKKGDKVQFTIQFRGRERFHREIGFEILESILKDFGDKVKIDRRPSMDGRQMIMILTPVKGAFDKVEIEDEGPEVEQTEQENTEATQSSASTDVAEEADDDTQDKAAETSTASVESD